MVFARSHDERKGRHFGPYLLGLAIWAVAGASDARAGISFVDMFRSEFLTQTGDGNSLTTQGFRFDSHLFSTGDNDYSAVQLTVPGSATPLDMSQTDPKTFAYGSSLFATQGLLDAAFPTGTYQFNASGPSGSSSTSFAYTTDAYPQSLPFLTGTTFSDLQGMNPAAPFTFQFSPFITGSGASASFLFLSIFDRTTNALVFNQAFLPATTTSLEVPANTLPPDHSYTYELIFSDRVTIPKGPNAVFDTQFGFDLRTQGNFRAAAVPEPSALLLLAQAGVGAGCLTAIRLRTRRSRAGGRGEAHAALGQPG
jgi:hypothetical protein